MKTPQKEDVDEELRKRIRITLYILQQLYTNAQKLEELSRKLRTPAT
jgi:hypothetical protein